MLAMNKCIFQYCYIQLMDGKDSGTTMVKIDISSGSNVMTFSLFSSRMVLSSSTAKLVVKITFLATGTVVIGSIVHLKEISYIVIVNDLTLKVVCRYITKVSIQNK